MSHVIAGINGDGSWITASTLSIPSEVNTLTVPFTENGKILTQAEAEEKGIAKRFNTGKPRVGLVPADAILEEAKVWAAGAVKYGDYNWEKLWGEKTVAVVMDSLLRHAMAIQQGESHDSETGYQHAAHIRCNAAMLIRHFNTKP